MTDALVHSLQQLSLWLTAALLLSLLAGFAYPVLRRFVGDCSPQSRALATWCYGLSAPVAAILVVVLVMHPDLSALLVPIHCHGDACASHAPVFRAASAGGVAVSAVSVALLLSGLIVCARGLWAGKRRLRTLFRFSEAPPDACYRLVERPEPLAWCCGLLQPRIFVSRGMVDRLAPRELAVVLAHEQAHAERRDNLRRLALTWATLGWPRPLRRRIRDDFEQAAEEICDLAASRRSGDPALVAAVIQALAGIPAGAGHSRGAAFLATGPEARVAALLERSEAPASAFRAWLAVWLTWAVQVTAMTGLAHVLLEAVSAIGA